MSIPGLGQITAQHVESSTRIVSLYKAEEWRFRIAPGAVVTVRLMSGTAEKDGIELAQRGAYTLTGPLQSKLLTWHGCELEVDGRCETESVARLLLPQGGGSAGQHVRPGENAAAVSYLNLHARLAEMRAAAVRDQCEGPRVLVTGGGAAAAAAADDDDDDDDDENDDDEGGNRPVQRRRRRRPRRRQPVGKTTLVRTLASYATRQGQQPVVVNVDPGEGMLSLAGTLSAAVFATVMDPTAAGGWGGTPTSGPSTVPVKLPLVYYFGRRVAEEDPVAYRRLVGRLAGGVSGRLSEDAEVRSAGVLIDGIGVEEGRGTGLELLAHVVDEMSVNIIVILGTTGANAEITRRFATEKTSLGERIQVITLEASDGVVDVGERFGESGREAVIKEYFFGDVRRTLSPQIQQVDFDSLVIYRVPNDEDAESDTLVRQEADSTMEHWTLAVMHASVRDAPETIRTATVMGFVYVADVDGQRRKMKMLAPVSGRLGDRPLVWGAWPEPFMNLLG